jgi:hypothetical protein
MKLCDILNFYLHFAQVAIRFTHYYTFFHLTESSNKDFPEHARCKPCILMATLHLAMEILPEVYPFRVLMPSRGLLVTTETRI